MKIVYFSTGSRGRVCLREVLDGGHTVAAVVGSGADEALEAFCRDRHIPVYVEKSPNTEAFAGVLRGLGADLFVCSGYNRILKPIVFGIPPRGTINLHGGRLPDYRGAAPINWQIINGEPVGGCAVLFMDAGIDTGPIIRQELYPIAGDDTHQSVLDKTLKIFPRLLGEVLRQMDAGDVPVTAQRPDEGCHYSRRYPEDSRIDWSARTDTEVHNLVRGMQGPYPHAFTFWRDEQIEIERTSLLPDTVRGVPGRVALSRGDGVIVICRDRGVLVHEIRIAGERVTPRGLVKAGEKFV